MDCVAQVVSGGGSGRSRGAGGGLRAEAAGGRGDRPAEVAATCRGKRPTEGDGNDRWFSRQRAVVNLGADGRRPGRRWGDWGDLWGPVGGGRGVAICGYMARRRGQVHPDSRIGAHSDMEDSSIGVNGVDGRIGGSLTGMDGVDGRMGASSTRLDGVEVRMRGSSIGVNGVDGRIGGSLTRIDGVDGRMGGSSTGVDGVEGRMGGYFIGIDGEEEKKFKCNG
ncbi:uncharacterized protein LOC131874385 [Cryptomeria japonica]|uniref:uncharacterized protein LOC131874385 n=1 Tax=Cryptomeria japonica TaxID=3369 RepID=UPI0027DA4DA6|nr:uncharacterized protein LOC131874385 [Cryptomeria japonica]